MQCTLREIVTISGTGVHSGEAASLTLVPAPPNTGVIFVQDSYQDSKLCNWPNVIESGRSVILESPRAVAATYANVCDTKMCTQISNGNGVTIGTIEHLCSALWAMEIDNVVIFISGAEVPIMDGSAAAFLDAISGTKKQPFPRQYLAITKEIHLHTHDDKHISISPPAVLGQLIVEATIDFPHSAIGCQRRTFDSDRHCFTREIGKARTFGFLRDYEHLKQLGLARGATLDNVVVLDDNRVTNPSGLLYPDEFVRHKILDCIGDLYLGGYRLSGHIRCHKSGHQLHNQILHKIFDTPNCYLLTTL